MEYRLRFAALEWSKIEYELTRERGLWGPDKPSPLDKWMVDIVEGEGRSVMARGREREMVCLFVCLFDCLFVCLQARAG